MSYRRIGMWLICGSLLWLGACDSSDPAAEGSGDAIAIASDKSIVIAAPGDSFNITSWVLDQTSSRIGTPITLVPGAGLTLQSDTFVTELAETRATIRLGAGTAGSSVVLQAEGLEDTVFVIVASPGTAAGAPALIFRSPIPVFTEDIAAEVAGGTAVVLSRTPTELALLLPFGASGETSFAFEAFGANANVDLTGTVVVSGAATNEASEPNNTRAQAQAAQLDTDIYGSLSGSDVLDSYAFTITEAGDYEWEVGWNDDSDVDLIVQDAAGATVGSAETLANPEHVTLTLQPGTYYARLLMFTHSPGDLPVTTYTLRVTKLP
jgi:hypothetical protein